MKKIFAIFLTCSLIVILLSGVVELPTFGMKNNPANNEVMRHYIEKAAEETGAMNIVTGIILDYRAFDTFVEASVLFTAVIVVIMILRQIGDDNANQGFQCESIISKEINRIVNPFIQIFGVYIIIFGHLSPGGGFAGGTIVGAGLILYYITCGIKDTGKVLSYDRLVRLLCLAIMLYGILKGYVFITGGSHIDSIQPTLGTPGNILSGGLLLPLNILVGIVVSITMYSFYSLFDRGDV